MKRLVYSLLGILILNFIGFSQNLINNGSFEFGGSGVGFVAGGNGYQLISPPFSGNTNAGDYAFVTNPNAVASYFVATGDHTSGTGKMMAIDGTTVGGQQRFWKAGNNGGGICNLIIGQTYSFRYWIRSITNSNFASIGVSFNNATSSLISGTVVAPQVTSGWQEVVYSFVPTNACVNIELYNNTTDAIGNDFAIDDLSVLAPPLPLSATYSITQPNCSSVNSALIAIYPKGGIAPFQYELSGSALTNSLINNTGVFTNLNGGTFQFMITDANGSTFSEQNIEITTATPLVVSPQDTSICPGNTVTLTASGGLSNYTWTSNNLAEPGFPIVSTNVSVSPLSSTTYTVSSNINNLNHVTNGDFEQGNTGFQTDYTYYNPSNPTGAQRAYGIITNSNSWFDQFSSCVDHTSGTGKMMVLDGSTYNLGNDSFWCQKIAVEPNKNYVFSYWVSSVSSLSPANIKSTLNGALLGSFSVPSSTCVWTQEAYNWNSLNNTLAEICLIDENYEGAGNDFAIDDISFLTNSNCTKEVSITMLNENTALNFSYPNIICLNDGIIEPVLESNFNNGGTFLSTSELDINAATGSVNADSSQAGTYVVQYSVNVCGNNLTSNSTITIQDLPNITTLSGGSAYCEGESINPITANVYGTGPFTIYYTQNEVPLSVTQNSTSINLGTNPGIYSVDSILDAQCINSIYLTDSIVVYEIPIAPSIIGEDSVCLNSNAEPLSVQNPQGSINWYGDENLTSPLSSGNTLTVSTQQNSIYYATQTINTCESPPSAFQISVIACEIAIPSAFTPNNDQENDVWELVNLDLYYPNNKVKIFNRWGNVLFESKQGKYSENPWDGTYQNKSLPVGSYFYVIDLSEDDSIEPLNGSVSIILRR
jgi:gliding motility-associated-like protein